MMYEAIFVDQWPWYVGGPLIGVAAAAYAFVFNKTIGMSSMFEFAYRDLTGRKDTDVAETSSVNEALAEMMANGAQVWIDSGKNFEAIVEMLFVHALGRTPADREKETLRELVGTSMTAQGIEDLLWMLGMHPEFQLIY